MRLSPTQNWRGESCTWSTMQRKMLVTPKSISIVIFLLLRLRSDLICLQTRCWGVFICCYSRSRRERRLRMVLRRRSLWVWCRFVWGFRRKLLRRLLEGSFRELLWGLNKSFISVSWGRFRQGSDVILYSELKNEV